jgi:hypothetical protein
LTTAPQDHRVEALFNVKFVKRSHG